MYACSWWMGDVIMWVNGSPLIHIMGDTNMTSTLRGVGGKAKIRCYRT